MSATKRPCTSKDLAATEDGELNNISSCSRHQTLSINDLMPVEMIEMILIETVVAQTLRANRPTTTCAIKKCSRHDDNLALVCPLWHKIVDGRQFREVVMRRIARIDSKALYTQRAEPVTVKGLGKEIYGVAAMNDTMYTIEDSINDGPIIAYDTHLIRHRSELSRDSFFELACINRRSLPPITGLEHPSALLPSPKENCLFVQPSTFFWLEPAQKPQIFKLAHDGTVSAHWSLDPELRFYQMAVDSQGQRIVISDRHFAHIFTTTGLHLGTVSLNFGQYIPLKRIGIRADSTVSVKFKQVTLVGGSPKVVYSHRILLLEPTTTSEGLLEYPSIYDAIDSGRYITIPDIDTKDSEHGAVLFDGDGPDADGCLLAVMDKGLVIMDTQGKTVLTAKDLGKEKEFQQFDESRGLMFFITSVERRVKRNEGRELHVFQVRHSR